LIWWYGFWFYNIKPIIMKTRNLGLNFLIALAAALIVFFTFSLLGNSPVEDVSNNPPVRYQQNMPENYDPGAIDFTWAASHTINAVVHVQTERKREDGPETIFDFFFGPREREQEQEPVEGMGSGVILTENGYIVTNYHVIAEADNIEVTLHDQRSFTAEVMGIDPDTDLAILKIDGSGFPYITIGNSDELQVGEWVLAVGNPFGLNSSVTAGIISAKERTLGVLQGAEMPIESFLQTDAAVNMGNSGGALVNLRGELVGIPTLIISPTRTNIGTAFAVPSSIVRRVHEDIMEFGEVRRGILGVSVRPVTPEIASQQGLDAIEGVYVEGTVRGSAADEAGVISGDVILGINGVSVNSPGELQQEVASHQPGETVDISLVRDGSEMEFSARLLSVDQHRELIMQQEETLLGATFRMVPEEITEQFNLPGGVQVSEVRPGELQEAGIREEFILIAINRQLINEPSHVLLLLEDYEGDVIIEGLYPDGTPATYTFRL
jgi:serine protease Do